MIRHIRAYWLLAGFFVIAFGAGCSGGGGGSSVPSGAGSTATPTVPVPTATPIAPVPTAMPTSAAVFNDWATYGFDNSRGGFNPNSLAFTPARLATLHVAWASTLGDFNTGTQPIVATGIGTHKALLFVGGGSGTEYAYDGTTGVQAWTRSLGTELYSCGGGGGATFGIGGSAVYERASGSIFVPDGKNTASNAPAQVSVFRLAASSGAILGSADIAPNMPQGELDFAHSGLTLSNGILYAGTSSTCDLSSWRGRVAAVNASTMTLTQTFSPVYGQGGTTYGGGGVWSWGGVAVDGGGDVYVSAGNADTGTTQPAAGFVPAPSDFAAYGEHFMRLSSDLTTLRASNHPAFPAGSYDADLSGTPVLFKPAGCSTLAAVQGKSGGLYLYDTGTIANGPLAAFQLAPTSDAAINVSNPGYSPVTSMLYASVASSSLYSPGMVGLSIAGCTSATVAWHAQFGPDSLATGYPRSAPTVTAGGVIFVGTPGTGDGGELWAVDAVTGTVLNNGAPLLTTAAHIRMAPVVDGLWLWVLDNRGDLYGLTLDPSFAAIQNAHRQLRTTPSRIRFRT